VLSFTALQPIIVSTFKESMHCEPACSPPMETKDTFMRFVVIGSIVAVGALALIVRMHA
jgi:hypothetical protein